jgi:hypothetical protein
MGRALSEKFRDFGLATLVTLSGIYLAFPCLLFFLGWLRWGIALPIGVLFILAVFGAIRAWWNQSHSQPTGAAASFGGSESLPAKQIFLPKSLFLEIAIPLFLLVILLWGTGGYGPQDSDHPKHNAILKTLIQEDWPPHVASDRGEFPLVFYVAYYLPASLVGKNLGWPAANHFLQWWSAFGLALSMIWFCILARHNSWAVPLIFFFFSGLDIVGATVLRFAQNLSQTGHLLPLVGGQIDWYSLRWWNWQMRWWDMELARNYPNPIEQLFFVPHQAIAGWMATGLLVTAGLNFAPLALRTLGIWCTVLALWSPLILMGLIPIIVWLLHELMITDGRKPLKVVWQTAGWPNVLVMPSFLVVALYFLARFAPLPFPGSPEARFGVGHHSLDWNIFLLRLALFLTLEVGVIVAILAFTPPWESARERRLAFWVGIWLMVLPFFRYGACNDLVMRASVPGLYVLAAWCARVLSHSGVARWKKLLLAGTLLMGATAPLSDLYAHFREIFRRGRLLEIPAFDNVADLWELNLRATMLAEEVSHPLIKNFKGHEFFLQYIGSSDTLFFRFLAKPSSAEASRANRQERTAGAAIVREHPLFSKGGTMTSRSPATDKPADVPSPRELACREQAPEFGVENFGSFP